MPRRKKENKENIKDILQKEKIQEMPATEVIKNNFMPYAMSVIVSRAIPEIDGLKPSHRKILYTMYEMGLMGNQRTKSANVASRTMLYNPHGDQGNYDTAVHMSQHNETLLLPTIDGKGSFGKHYSRDTKASASRYTEMKLMPIAHEFFDSIKKDTVDFVDNYDATSKEPVLLPVSFPNILANPTEGIAVGFASSIPSFNLSELCEATIARMQHPRKDLTEIMPGPDFTTGAELLLDPDKMREIYKTGTGSIKLRSKYRVDTKAHIIEVYEIPYTTTVEAIIEGIISGIKAGKISEVSDVRNEIGLDGFRMAIDYKRGVDPDALMKKLFRLTKLQDTYSFNMTVLIDGHPLLLGVYGILDEWIKWRKTCVKRELIYDRDKKKHELHILEGLAKVLLDIDKAIKIIRKTKNDEEVVPALMKAFKIDEEQASYVADIKLRNLNKDYILNKTSAIDVLKKEIKELEKEIGSEKEIEKLIIKKLRDVSKKYGKERKTEILREYEDIDNTVAEEVPDYPVKVYVTKEGYVKKLALTSLKTDPEIKFKEGDKVLDVYDTANSKELLVFTDKCNVYKTRFSDLQDAKPSGIADYIPNICNLDPDENILLACPSDAGENVLIGFRNGKVAKFPISVYETKQNRKKIITAFSDKSMVLKIYIIKGDEDFLMTSSKGKLLVFNSSKVPLKTTRTTQGVQVLRLSKNVECMRFSKTEDMSDKEKKEYGSKNIPAAGKLMQMRLKI